MPTRAILESPIIQLCVAEKLRSVGSARIECSKSASDKSRKVLTPQPPSQQDLSVEQ